MLKKHILDLQLFAEGDTAVADGMMTEETEETGEESSAAAGQEEKLLELGVPESKIRKKAPQTEKEEKLIKLGVPEDKIRKSTEASHRLTWDEIKKDPEYNRAMQETVSARLKESKAAQAKLTKLQPALDAIAKKYGVDAGDFDAVVNAVSAEGALQERQSENGQSETKPAASGKAEQAARQHFSSLLLQGEQLKRTFPEFNLMEEIKNPAFVRMTSPSGGVSVADAYYAVHRAEIMQKTLTNAADEAVRRIYGSVRANGMRPDETGQKRQAQSVTSFGDYRSWTKNQRDSLKERIKRGEKIYPEKR